MIAWFCFFVNEKMASVARAPLRAIFWYAIQNSAQSRPRMRSILALSIIDAKGVALDFLSAADGAFALEQSAYDFRVLFPLAVGESLGLEEAEAISMAKRARLSSAQAGVDERVIRLVLFSPRPFTEGFAISPLEQEGLLKKMEEKVQASLFACRILFEEDADRLAQSWLTELGFKPVYALLEKHQMDRCAQAALQGGDPCAHRLRL